MPDKKTCYIINPAANEIRPVKRHMEGIINAVIIPVLGETYEILVDSRRAKPGYIDKDVLLRIYESDLVIANLSQANPNVMYQLAFRHSLGTPVIMIAEEGTSLPCFFSDQILYYINDAQGVLELTEKLMAYMETADLSKSRSGPVYDALRGRMKEDGIVKEDFDSLEDILRDEEMEEINETEYLFLKDLLQEEKNSPDVEELGFGRDFLKNDIIVDKGAEPEPEKEPGEADAGQNAAAANPQHQKSVGETADNSIFRIVKRFFQK